MHLPTLILALTSASNTLAMPTQAPNTTATVTFHTDFYCYSRSSRCVNVEPGRCYQITSMPTA